MLRCYIGHQQDTSHTYRYREYLISLPYVYATLFLQEDEELEAEMGVALESSTPKHPLEQALHLLEKHDAESAAKLLQDHMGAGTSRRRQLKKLEAPRVEPSVEQQHEAEVGPVAEQQQQQEGQQEEEEGILQQQAELDDQEQEQQGQQLEAEAPDGS